MGLELHIETMLFPEMLAETLETPHGVYMDFCFIALKTIRR